MESKSQKILVFLPVFNEGGKVADLINEIRSMCNYPILIVNDGSNLLTSVTIRRLSPDHIIEHSRNLGPGATLRTAFDFAKYNSVDILVTLDADGQHDPKYIPMLINAIKAADMVTGSRFHSLSDKRTPIPPLRNKANLVLSQIVSEFISTPITDSACGFRAYRNKAIDYLDLTVRGYGWPFQVWIQARNAKLKIKEIPIPNIYLDSYRDLEHNSFRSTIEYCVRILRRESIKCCLSEILKLRIPSMHLAKLALMRHYSKIGI